MSENRKSNLMAVLNAVGGISGILSIGLVIFSGGSLVEKVRGMDVRVQTLEATSGPSFHAHEAKDDDRDAAQNLRLEKLEAAVNALPRIESKLDRLIERTP
jgi:hypothetical protein